MGARPLWLRDEIASSKTLQRSPKAAATKQAATASPGGGTKKAAQGPKAKKARAKAKAARKSAKKPATSRQAYIDATNTWTGRGPKPQ